MVCIFTPHANHVRETELYMFAAGCMRKIYFQI